MSCHPVTLSLCSNGAAFSGDTGRRRPSPAVTVWHPGGVVSTADLPATEKRTAFARRIGVRRSYVTQLAKEERIVCDAKGDVLVPESLARLEETHSPDKEQVAQRWAKYREEEAQRLAGGDAMSSDDEDDPEAEPGSDIPSYQRSRALKEHYAAMAAKADYERTIGALCSVDDIKRGGADIGAAIRSSHEQVADRLASKVAASADTEACHALITDALTDVLHEITDQIKRLIDANGSEAGQRGG